MREFCKWTIFLYFFGLFLSQTECLKLANLNKPGKECVYGQGSTLTEAGLLPVMGPMQGPICGIFSPPGNYRGQEIITGFSLRTVCPKLGCDD